VISVGDILFARTHKEGPDYITEIIAADGHFALVNGIINLPFKGQVSYSTLVNALVNNIAQYGILAGNLDIPSGGYQMGKTLCGSPLTLLADLAKKMNRSMSIVNGVVNILPFGANDESPTILVSQQTGLIGIPEIQPPGNLGLVAKTNTLSPELDLTFTHLLRPELQIHKQVTINSKFINGQYNIIGNTFEFDSWDGPFFNKCVCTKPVAVA
jgi:hypothetical protein